MYGRDVPWPLPRSRSRRCRVPLWSREGTGGAGGQERGQRCWDEPPRTPSAPRCRVSLCLQQHGAAMGCMAGAGLCCPPVSCRGPRCGGEAFQADRAACARGREAWSLRCARGGGGGAGGCPSSAGPVKERCEDTFVKGLPQKYFVAFAALYKCEPLSFCSGVLPIRGF